jgi:hypothetical protein
MTKTLLFVPTNQYILYITIFIFIKKYINIDILCKLDILCLKI